MTKKEFIQEDDFSQEDDMIPEDVTVVDTDLQDMRTQTALDKAFQELFNEASIEKKTEFLKNDEIKKLGTLYTMGEHYGFVALQKRVIKHMQMRISLKRKGRTEAVDMFKAERQHDEIRNAMNQYQRPQD